MDGGYLAEIRGFGGNFAPRSWALCDGQTLPIAQNQALFSLLGTTFGGDGRTSFGLPDLRGRTPMHKGTGPGLAPVALGQKGGAEYVTLTTLNLPAHSHTVTQSTIHSKNGDGDKRQSGGNYVAGDAAVSMYSDTYDTQLNAQSVVVQVGMTGGQQPMPLRNPYCGIYMIICTQGIFPSRN